MRYWSGTRGNAPVEDGTPITLELRTSGPADPVTALAHPVLTVEPHESGGLPWLHGSFRRPVPVSSRLVLRIHNRAGIPIIEGHCEIAAGEQRFTCTTLRPLGIEAYAHVSEAQRQQTAQRIWSRRVYATLQRYPLEPKRT